MGCGVAYLAGMVYVVGGVTTKKQVFTGMVPAEVLSTVHATDTNERTWVRRPSLPEPRAYCTALTIHHELWLAGGLKPSGRDPTGFTNVADVLAFDSLRGRWEFRFKLSRPRHAVAAASADDRVYVLGGMSCLDGTSVEDVDVYHRQRLTFLDCECLPKKLTGRVVLHYHVLKNRWDLCGMMPEPRSYHAAVLIGNTVYVTGGFDPDTRKCGELVACKTTYAYDIDSMEWSRKADMKMGRAAHGAACFHDRILVFGGRGRFGRAVASTEEYDPASDTWKECTPLDVPRMAVGCATVGDVIYVVGGMIPETGDFYRAVDRVDIYCPKTHTWSEGPPLPKPRAFPAAACLDGKLWLVGGCYDNSEPGLPLVSLRDVDVLEPSGWVHVGCTVHSRHAAAIAVAGEVFILTLFKGIIILLQAVNTNIYVIGGTSSVLNGPLKRPEVYLQLDDCYKFPAEYPEAMTGMSAVCVPPAKPTFRSQSLTCMVKDRLAE
ncbi:hypothetical protein V5799_022425 [Amblyomma americanum]|uniref:Uncharacterized protein n=1 Tax=Amblyomma americanum TaxID=6943 RepID=A0AAQ4FM43_AMBAM